MLHGELAGVAMVDKFTFDGMLKGTPELVRGKSTVEEELANMVMFDSEQPVAGQALKKGVKLHEFLYSDPKGEEPDIRALLAAAGACRAGCWVFVRCAGRGRACERRFYLHSLVSTGNRFSLLCWTCVNTLCGPRPSLTRMWSRMSLRPLLDLHFLVLSYRFAPLRAALLGMCEYRQAVESGRVNKQLSHTVKEDENFMALVANAVSAIVRAD